MKGIILAGGSGSRMHPLTLVTSKQLLPVYDKPMIYYSLSTLMLSGIKDILIISTPEDTSRFESLLGDGSHFGINLSYKIQPSPNGLPEAFILGEDFIGDDSVAMILGDNIFYGPDLKEALLKAANNAQNNRATVFGYEVEDPRRFGVMEVLNGKLISIEEKPEKHKSNIAMMGLYFYPKGVSQKAKLLKPSKRNELEITDLTLMYMSEDKVDLEMLSKSHTWIDAGTIESLMDASNFVRKLKAEDGIIIGDPEIIAKENNWI